MANDPRHQRRFEKLLLLAAQRGDADLVTERLSWGIDPDCRTKKGRTPLMVNVRGSCPSAATVRALLAGGADPDAIDHTGLTAIDHARRKLSRLQTHPREPSKSPSLDENDQLQLSADEQAELDRMRAEHPDLGPEFFQLWWRERLRAASRAFNDPQQVELIVELLESTERG